MKRRIVTAAGALAATAAVGVLAAGPALAVGSIKVTGPSTNGGTAIIASASATGVALTSKTYVAITRSGGTCSVTASVLKCTGTASAVGSSAGTTTANASLACTKGLSFAYTVYYYNSSVGGAASTVSKSVVC